MIHKTKWWYNEKDIKDKPGPKCNSELYNIIGLWFGHCKLHGTLFHTILFVANDIYIISCN